MVAWKRLWGGAEGGWWEGGSRPIAGQRIGKVGGERRGAANQNWLVGRGETGARPPYLPQSQVRDTARGRGLEDSCPVVLQE